MNEVLSAPVSTTVAAEKPVLNVVLADDTDEWHDRPGLQLSTAGQRRGRGDILSRDQFAASRPDAE